LHTPPFPTRPPSYASFVSQGPEVFVLYRRPSQVQLTRPPRPLISLLHFTYFVRPRDFYSCDLLPLPLPPPWLIRSALDFPAGFSGGKPPGFLGTLGPRRSFFFPDCRPSPLYTTARTIVLHPLLLFPPDLELPLVCLSFHCPVRVIALWWKEHSDCSNVTSFSRRFSRREVRWATLLGPLSQVSPGNTSVFPS